MSLTQVSFFLIACIPILGGFLKQSSSSTLALLNSVSNEIEDDNHQYQYQLEQFKSEVYHYITAEFMKTDAYLLRWLKAYDFDTEETIQKFKDCIAWRKEHNMDTILQEDFSKIDSLFPFGFEGVDKDGRPVVWGPTGTYDVRKITIAGEQKLYQRYLVRIFELAETLIYEIAKESGQQNITQMVAIYDLAGFNLKRGGCYRCIAMIPEFISNLEGNYPQIFYRIYYINTPRLFETTLQIARSLMSEASRESMQVFDYDKSKWVAGLLSQIPADQLSEEFGGTKAYARPELAAAARKNAVMKILEKARENLSDNSSAVQSSTTIAEYDFTELDVHASEDFSTTVTPSIEPSEIILPSTHKLRHHHHYSLPRNSITPPPTSDLHISTIENSSTKSQTISTQSLIQESNNFDNSNSRSNSSLIVISRQSTVLLLLLLVLLDKLDC